MTGVDLLKKSIENLERYISAQQFAGYDPYDALKSPLFRLPILRSSKILRLSAQQILRRSPLNIRPLLRIPKGNNPVTLGLCAQAYAYLSQIDGGANEYCAHQIEGCIRLLEGSVSRGCSGACWGYDFDWEARYAKTPAFTPTVVATGIITNGLFESNRYVPNAKAVTFCKSAVEFVLNDLQKSTEDDSFCYSYSPFDRQKVLNATMKGARLLSQVFSVTRDERLLTEARKTVLFVLRHQRRDGAWPYAVGDTRAWVDNFHTGYMLDCLEEYSKNSDDRECFEGLQRGFQYYKEHFFSKGAVPKYYSNGLYPIDATAVAQSILTLARFGELKLALNVAEWSIKHMQDPSGFFYYQRHRWFTNRVSYMRWSNAWMFTALSYLLMKTHSHVVV